MADRTRYRVTRAAFDVVSVFGCIGATRVPGPVFAAVLRGRGYSPSHVRNQLTQLVRRGLMRSSSHGRTTIYELASPLVSNFNKLAGAPEELIQDLAFWAIIHQIPESERSLRDRVVYLAGYAGYQSLRPGVLIAMRDGEADTRSALEDVVLPGRIEFCRVVASDLEQARRWVAVVWNTARMTSDIAQAEGIVAALERTLDAPESRYFDVFHKVSMLQMRTPDIPASLAPDLRALERLACLQARLIGTYAARYAADVLLRALTVPAARLISFDEAFWQRTTGTSEPSLDKPGQD